MLKSISKCSCEIKETRKAYYLEDPSKGAEYYSQYMEKNIKPKHKKKLMIGIAL